MLTRRLAAALGATIVIGLAGPSHAWNNLHKTTYLTFSRSVSVQGVELGAGTYVFELAIPETSQNIVRVLSRDRRKVYVTTLTSLVSRPRNLAPNQLITFRETPRGMPPAIDTWFPLGDSTGRRFQVR